MIDNSALINTDFDFDQEIFTSRVYREAMKSHMKRAIVSRSTDQQDNGQSLAKDIMVRDHAMAHTIIENYDVHSQTREEHEKKDTWARVLVLGTSESGKSTLLKSLRLLHEGPYTTSERISFAEIVFSNVILSMRVILEAMESLEIPLELSQNEEHVATINIQARCVEQDNLSPAVTKAIRILWQDTGVVKTFQRSREYQLCDCTE